MFAYTNQTMSLSTRQTIESMKYRLQMLIPSLTMISFIGFAFFMGTMIVLSIIPLYIENKSIEKTRFIQTTVRMNNYTLYMSRSLGKRDLIRLTSVSNTTFDEARMMMNSSIQYALEQQLKSGDNREKFNIYILQMISYTDNPTNMSVTLDLLIVYSKECISCNKHRQLIISEQLCSNNQLLNSIYFLIQYSNLSYTISNPVIVYTSYIPIENIIVHTQTISTSQLSNTINTNLSTTQISNQFLANNYTLTVSTLKSNYFATLDQTGTQTSANQNDGPVPLVGAVTMYPEMIQIIERQTQLSNSSNGLNITINHIILQFWYSNSTIQIVIDFLINFPTSCDNQCMNQRSNQLINQLNNLTNIQIHIQPSNLTDGQVKIYKNGNYILYDYSLTTQIISNFTGTIIHAISPTFTIIY